LNRVSAPATGAALLAIGLVLAGCSGSTSSPTSKPRLTPESLASSLAAPVSDAASGGCARSELPRGFVADKAHSGALTAHTYSASADVQAALEYDAMQAGSRRVFTRRPAGAHSPVSAVVTCVSMTFASAPQAARFFSSYRYTRDRAPSVVQKIAAPTSVPGVTGATAYLEKRQSFRGYGITSTNVVEVAGLEDRTLLIASVAGTKPSSTLAGRLLGSMAGAA